MAFYDKTHFRTGQYRQVADDTPYFWSAHLYPQTRPYVLGRMRPVRIRGLSLEFKPCLGCNEKCDMVESMLRECGYCHISKQVMRIQARVVMNTAIKRVYIDVPESGVSKLKDFVTQNGWNLTIVDRMSLLNDFIKTRPQNPDITEEEIMKEVRVVRYGE